MSYKITMYALSTCRNCANLKKMLDDRGISYSEIVCDDDRNSSICDDIENDIDCQLYPIVKITKKVQKDAGGYHVYVDDSLIVHYCNSYEDLFLKNKINHNCNAICVNGVMDMMDLIQKHI